MSFAATTTLFDRQAMASERLQEQLIASTSGKENTPGFVLIRLDITGKNKQWTSHKL
jgi:hypothetical protein